MIDLRSDTVTRPTPEMLQAMHNAKVGDDVFGEDPTLNALEEKVARLFGHEAGLYCPSGTMTNQIALQVHMQPGGEVICSEYAHIYHYEGGGIAANAGCSVRLLAGNRGMFTAEQVEQNINPDDVHAAQTQLIALENTMNKGGGAVWKLKEIQSIRSVCNQHELPMHLDGARVFNALIATGNSVAELGQQFDSISICLSKGLGCPVGSVLIGTSAFIHKARRIRKRMGGGMRQAGYLAAAGIYALDHHVARLKADHERAKALEETLKHCSFVDHCHPVETNIVLFNVKPSIERERILQELKSKSILAMPMGANNIRLVTHLDFTDEHLEQTQKALLSIEL